MFNFLDEIKNNLKKIDQKYLNNYNLINISGKILYVEGHCGLTILSKNIVAFKIKKGRVVVEGENLFLSELTFNTLKIEGNIKKVEEF